LAGCSDARYRPRCGDRPSRVKAAQRQRGWSPAPAGNCYRRRRHRRRRYGPDRRGARKGSEASLTPRHKYTRRSPNCGQTGSTAEGVRVRRTGSRRCIVRQAASQGPLSEERSLAIFCRGGRAALRKTERAENVLRTRGENSPRRGRAARERRRARGIARDQRTCDGEKRTVRNGAAATTRGLPIYAAEDSSQACRRRRQATTAGERANCDPKLRRCRAEPTRTTMTPRAAARRRPDYTGPVQQSLTNPTTSTADGRRLRGRGMPAAAPARRWNGV